MDIIVTKDSVKYTAGEDKKVKFINGKRSYSEIVVGFDDEREVVGVEDKNEDS